ncbi:microtubule-associated protein futsch [Planococcus citri]|uniref:microtubule-associated protein futsch n=1 Tax=Planococcus citri TaxID=170843 RepID=UPI0031F9AECA
MEESTATVPKDVPLPPLSTASATQPYSGRPPPSPLSGGYLLIVISETLTDAHKAVILQKLSKAFLSWNVEDSGIDIERELAIVTALSPEGDFAKNGERLIQNASEHLVTEILIHPQINTMRQCIRNLLSSFTKYRFIIHAGYVFCGNGSWILQDGTFSVSDFIDAFQEVEVQRVIRAYEKTVKIDICCIAEGGWTQSRLQQEPFSKVCQLEINPSDKIAPGNVAVREFIDYLEQYIIPSSIEHLLEPSDIVGNIRFTHPTLYVFPGGEGDAALFGINGFNMLVDGGFSKKACFWNFVRHLDRLDAVLMTRVNNSNIGGMSGVVERKVFSPVYPQIGHFFSNLQGRKQLPSPDGDKDREPLLVNLIEEGDRMVMNLKPLQLKPHHCYRDAASEPINLYHKVGHGKLDMYIISPAKDSREVKEFLSRWNNHDVRLFSGTSKTGNRELRVPLQNLVSICALLVWQPANPDDKITRILFPGSTPQHKIFEGLERLKALEFLKHSTCTVKSVMPAQTPLVAKPTAKKFVTKLEKQEKILDELAKSEAQVKSALAANENEVDSGPRSLPVDLAAPASAVKPTPLKPKRIVGKLTEKTVMKETKSKTEHIVKESSMKHEKSSIIDVADSQVGSGTKEAVEKKKYERKPVQRPTVAAPKPKPPVPSNEEKKPIESDKFRSPTTPKKSFVERKPTQVKSTTVITQEKDITSEEKSKETDSESILSKDNKEAMNKDNEQTTEAVTSTITSSTASSTTIAPAKEKETSTVTKSKEQTTQSLASTTSTASTTTKPISRIAPRTRTPPKVFPAKSLKDENNRKVAESKPMRTAPIKIVSSSKTTKKEDEPIVKAEKKPITKRTKPPVSLTPTAASTKPSVPAKPSSPVKVVRKPITIATKKLTGVADDKKLKLDSEKTDSSAVSTPSTLEADTTLLKTKAKSESIKAKSKESTKETVKSTAVKKIRPRPKPTNETQSDKTSSERAVIKPIAPAAILPTTTYVSNIITKQGDDEEDEILIIETTEMKSVSKHDYEEQKHLRDQNESEKESEVKDLEVSKSKEQQSLDFPQMNEKNVPQAEDKAVVTLTPEDKQKIFGEVQGIISTAAEMIATSKPAADQKIASAVDKAEPTKPQTKEIIHASQETSSTTAPTMPEDEKIDLDEPKPQEEIEEKYDKEETKEKSIENGQKSKIGATIPLVEQTSEDIIRKAKRDIVKTPDEVADLPVHEEVDVCEYETTETKEDEQFISAVTTEETKIEVVKPEHPEFVTITPTSSPDEKPLPTMASSKEKDVTDATQAKVEKDSSTEIKLSEKVVPESDVSPKSPQDIVQIKDDHTSDEFITIDLHSRKPSTDTTPQDELLEKETPLHLAKKSVDEEETLALGSRLASEDIPASTTEKSENLISKVHEDEQSEQPSLPDQVEYSFLREKEPGLTKTTTSQSPSELMKVDEQTANSLRKESLKEPLEEISKISDSKTTPQSPSESTKIDEQLDESLQKEPFKESPKEKLKSPESRHSSITKETLKYDQTTKSPTESEIKVEREDNVSRRESLKTSQDEISTKIDEQLDESLQKEPLKESPKEKLKSPESRHSSITKETLKYDETTKSPTESEIKVEREDNASRKESLKTSQEEISKASPEKSPSSTEDLLDPSKMAFSPTKLEERLDQLQRKESLKVFYEEEESQKDILDETSKLSHEISQTSLDDKSVQNKISCSPSKLTEEESQRKQSLKNLQDDTPELPSDKSPTLLDDRMDEKEPKSSENEIESPILMKNKLDQHEVKLGSSKFEVPQEQSQRKESSNGYQEEILKSPTEKSPSLPKDHFNQYETTPSPTKSDGEQGTTHRKESLLDEMSKLQSRNLSSPTDNELNKVADDLSPSKFSNEHDLLHREQSLKDHEKDEAQLLSENTPSSTELTKSPEKLDEISRRESIEESLDKTSNSFSSPKEPSLSPTQSSDKPEEKSRKQSIKEFLDDTSNLLQDSSSKSETSSFQSKDEQSKDESALSPIESTQSPEKPNEKSRKQSIKEFLDDTSKSCNDPSIKNEKSSSPKDELNKDERSLSPIGSMQSPEQPDEKSRKESIKEFFDNTSKLLQDSSPQSEKSYSSPKNELRRDQSPLSPVESTQLPQKLDEKLGKESIKEFLDETSKSFQDFTTKYETSQSSPKEDLTVKEISHSPTESMKSPEKSNEVFRKESLKEFLNETSKPFQDSTLKSGKSHSSPKDEPSEDESTHRITESTKSPEKLEISREESLKEFLDETSSLLQSSASKSEKSPALYKDKSSVDVPSQSPTQMATLPEKLSELSRKESLNEYLDKTSITESSNNLAKSAVKSDQSLQKELSKAIPESLGLLDEKSLSLEKEITIDETKPAVTSPTELGFDENIKSTRKHSVTFNDESLKIIPSEDLSNDQFIVCKSKHRKRSITDENFLDEDKISPKSDNIVCEKELSTESKTESSDMELASAISETNSSGKALSEASKQKDLDLSPEEKSVLIKSTQSLEQKDLELSTSIEKSSSRKESREGQTLADIIKDSAFDEKVIMTQVDHESIKQNLTEPVLSKDSTPETTKDELCSKITEQVSKNTPDLTEASKQSTSPIKETEKLASNANLTNITEVDSLQSAPTDAQEKLESARKESLSKTVDEKISSLESYENPASLREDMIKQSDNTDMTDIIKHDTKDPSPIEAPKKLVKKESFSEAVDNKVSHAQSVQESVLSKDEIEDSEKRSLSEPSNRKDSCVKNAQEFVPLKDEITQLKDEKDTELAEKVDKPVFKDMSGLDLDKSATQQEEPSSTKSVDDNESFTQVLEVSTSKNQITTVELDENSDSTKNSSKPSSSSESPSKLLESQISCKKMTKDESSPTDVFKPSLPIESATLTSTQAQSQENDEQFVPTKATPEQIPQPEAKIETIEEVKQKTKEEITMKEEDQNELTFEDALEDTSILSEAELLPHVSKTKSNLTEETGKSTVLIKDMKVPSAISEQQDQEKSTLDETLRKSSIQQETKNDEKFIPQSPKSPKATHSPRKTSLEEPTLFADVSKDESKTKSIPGESSTFSEKSFKTQTSSPENKLPTPGETGEKLPSSLRKVDSASSFEMQDSKDSVLSESYCPLGKSSGTTKDEHSMPLDSCSPELTSSKDSHPADHKLSTEKLSSLENIPDSHESSKIQSSSPDKEPVENKYKSDSKLSPDSEKVDQPSISSPSLESSLSFEQKTVEEACKTDKSSLDRSYSETTDAGKSSMDTFAWETSPVRTVATDKSDVKDDTSVKSSDVLSSEITTSSTISTSQTKSIDEKQIDDSSSITVTPTKEVCGIAAEYKSSSNTATSKAALDIEASNQSSDVSPSSHDPDTTTVPRKQSMKTDSEKYHEIADLRQTDPRKPSIPTDSRKSSTIADIHHISSDLPTEESQQGDSRKSSISVDSRKSSITADVHHIPSNFSTEDQSKEKQRSDDEKLGIDSRKSSIVLEPSQPISQQVDSSTSKSYSTSTKTHRKDSLDTPSNLMSDDAGKPSPSLESQISSDFSSKSTPKTPSPKALSTSTSYDTSAFKISSVGKHDEFSEHKKSDTAHESLIKSEQLSESRKGSVAIEQFSELPSVQPTKASILEKPPSEKESEISDLHKENLSLSSDLPDPSNEIKSPHTNEQTKEVESDVSELKSPIAQIQPPAKSMSPTDNSKQQSPILTTAAFKESEQYTSKVSVDSTSPITQDSLETSPIKVVSPGKSGSLTKLLEESSSHGHDAEQTSSSLTHISQESDKKTPTNLQSEMSPSESTSLETSPVKDLSPKKTDDNFQKGNMVLDSKRNSYAFESRASIESIAGSIDGDLDSKSLPRGSIDVTAKFDNPLDDYIIESLERAPTITSESRHESLGDASSLTRAITETTSLTSMASEADSKLTSKRSSIISDSQRSSIAYELDKDGIDFLPIRKSSTDEMKTSSSELLPATKSLDVENTPISPNDQEIITSSRESSNIEFQKGSVADCKRGSLTSENIQDITSESRKSSISMTLTTDTSPKESVESQESSMAVLDSKRGSLIAENVQDITSEPRKSSISMTSTTDTSPKESVESRKSSMAVADSKRGSLIAENVQDVTSESRKSSISMTSTTDTSPKESVESRKSSMAVADSKRGSLIAENVQDIISESRNSSISMTSTTDTSPKESVESRKSSIAVADSKRGSLIAENVQDIISESRKSSISMTSTTDTSPKECVESRKSSMAESKQGSLVIGIIQDTSSDSQKSSLSGSIVDPTRDHLFKDCKETDCETSHDYNVPSEMKHITDTSTKTWTTDTIPDSRKSSTASFVEPVSKETVISDSRKSSLALDLRKESSASLTDSASKDPMISVSRKGSLASDSRKASLGLDSGPITSTSVLPETVSIDESSEDSVQTKKASLSSDNLASDTKEVTSDKSMHELSESKHDRAISDAYVSMSKVSTEGTMKTPSLQQSTTDSRKSSISDSRKASITSDFGEKGILDESSARKTSLVVNEQNTDTTNISNDSLSSSFNIESSRDYIISEVETKESTQSSSLKHSSIDDGISTEKSTKTITVVGKMSTSPSDDVNVGTIDSRKSSLDLPESQKASVDSLAKSTSDITKQSITSTSESTTTSSASSSLQSKTIVESSTTSDSSVDMKLPTNKQEIVSSTSDASKAQTCNVSPSSTHMTTTIKEQTKEGKFDGSCKLIESQSSQSKSSQSSTIESKSSEFHTEASSLEKSSIIEDGSFPLGITSSLTTQKITTHDSQTSESSTMHTTDHLTETIKTHHTSTDTTNRISPDSDNTLESRKLSSHQLGTVTTLETCDIDLSHRSPSPDFHSHKSSTYTFTTIGSPDGSSSLTETISRHDLGNVESLSTAKSDQKSSVILKESSKVEGNQAPTETISQTTSLEPQTSNTATKTTETIVGDSKTGITTTTTTEIITSESPIKATSQDTAMKSTSTTHVETVSDIDPSSIDLASFAALSSSDQSHPGANTSDGAYSTIEYQTITKYVVIPSTDGSPSRIKKYTTEIIPTSVRGISRAEYEKLHDFDASATSQQEIPGTAKPTLQEMDSKSYESFTQIHPFSTVSSTMKHDPVTKSISEPHILTSPDSGALYMDANQMRVQFLADSSATVATATVKKSASGAVISKANSDETYDSTVSDTLSDLSANKFHKKEAVSKTVSLPILDEVTKQSSIANQPDTSEDVSRSLTFLEKIACTDGAKAAILSDPSSLNKQPDDGELPSKSVSLPVIKRPDDSEKYMTLPNLYKATNLEDLTAEDKIIEERTVSTETFSSTQTSSTGSAIHPIKESEESIDDENQPTLIRQVIETTTKITSQLVGALQSDSSSPQRSQTSHSEDHESDDGRSDTSLEQCSRITQHSGGAGHDSSQICESDEDELGESTMSTSSNIVHFKEDDHIQEQLATLQEETMRKMSSSMTQSFYGTYPDDEDDENDLPEDSRGPSVSSTMTQPTQDPATGDKKDPIKDWGRPLGLPNVRNVNKFLIWNPIEEWGRPLGLPMPAPPPSSVQDRESNGDIEINLAPINPPTNNNVTKGTPTKKVIKKPAATEKINTARETSKTRDSSVKRTKPTKPTSPVYVDLAYVPHHGNPYYTTVEFFKRIRARYYVFSGTDPSKDVFNALIEAKKTWEDQNLEVTIIPTYDTDVLGYWITENEETLANLKIDLSPSASRCTINLQDHDTSCSAYRLEF